jgi:predicted GH43/DUF377 family glycosyl hydrolase
VLARGAPGEWDAVDTLNPSVVRHGETYFNLYSGYDGSVWRTGLATSPDGIEWTKQGVVLEPDRATWEGAAIAANGSVARIGEELLYWYQAGDPHRIGMARSTDGKLWRKQPSPVLGLGPRGSWDEMAAGDPYVIAAGGRYYMYYLGQDRARRQRLGVAVSDDGVQWTKLRSNPILDLGGYGAFDEYGLGEPAVWAAHGRYWMLYTGRDRMENRRLGFAVSGDGARWERLPASTVIGGAQAWNVKVLCDPTVELTGGGVRVWFGGGDVASPDQNLNGQIGLGLLSWGGATLAE